jgi:hypothetical protein
MRNPHHTGNSWALWWGISLSLAFFAAATISFVIDRPPQNQPVYAVQAR